MDYIPDFMTNAVRGQDHVTTPVKGQTYDTVVLFLTQSTLEHLHFIPIASPGMLNRGEWGCAVSQRKAPADSVRVPAVSSEPDHNPCAHRLQFRAHCAGKSAFVRGTRTLSVCTVYAMRVEQECCVQLTHQQNEQKKVTYRPLLKEAWGRRKNGVPLKKRFGVIRAACHEEGLIRSFFFCCRQPHMSHPLSGDRGFDTAKVPSPHSPWGTPCIRSMCLYAVIPLLILRLQPGAERTGCEGRV